MTGSNKNGDTTLYGFGTFGDVSKDEDGFGSRAGAEWASLCPRTAVGRGI